jgi:YD repeat-containing protein
MNRIILILIVLGAFIWAQNRPNYTAQVSSSRPLLAVVPPHQYVVDNGFVKEDRQFSNFFAASPGQALSILAKYRLNSAAPNTSVRALIYFYSRKDAATLIETNPAKIQVFSSSGMGSWVEKSATMSLPGNLDEARYARLAFEFSSTTAHADFIYLLAAEAVLGIQHNHISEAITYVDDTGKRLQTLQTIADDLIVSAPFYDDLGNPKGTSLPVMQESENNLDYQTAFVDYTILNDLIELNDRSTLKRAYAVQTNYPYTESELRKSPLQSVIRQGSAGESWSLHGDYYVRQLEPATNTTTMALVHKSYPKERLMVEGTRVKVKSNEFVVNKSYKDWQGLHLRSETIIEDAAGNEIDKKITASKYDENGNLLKSYPPSYFKNSNQYQRVSEYEYNDKNQLIRKIIPDHDEWTEFVYDRFGTQILSRDPLAKSGARAYRDDNGNDFVTGWFGSFTDVQGRPLVAGELSLGTVIASDDFEDGDLGSGDIHWSGHGSVTTSTTRKRSGSESIKLHYTGSGNNYAYSLRTNGNSYLPVVAGNDYSFLVWYYLESDDKAAQSNFHNRSLSVTNKIESSARGCWNLLANTLSVPNGTTSAHVTIYGTEPNQAVGIVYYDDAMIIKHHKNRDDWQAYFERSSWRGFIDPLTTDDVKNGNGKILNFVATDTDFLVNAIYFYDDYEFGESGGSVTPPSDLNHPFNRLTRSIAFLDIPDPESGWLVHTYGNRQVETYFYDFYGFMREKHVELYLDGNLLYKRIYTYNYDTYSGAILDQQMRDPGNSEHDFYTWFEYDAAGRLSKVYNNNDASKPAQPDIHNRQYDQFGNITEATLNGTITATYEYDFTGRLTRIFYVEGGDTVFSETLHYENNPSSTYRRFDGNISRTTFAYNGDDSQFDQDYYYNYSYDRWGQLSAAYYSINDRHNTSYQYDDDGNITRLERGDGDDYAYDLFTYSYYQEDGVYKNNRLKRIYDAYSDNGVRRNSADMTYDANGNLLKDDSKNIQHIVYNSLNLPVLIYFTDGEYIEYWYDAAGNRIMKRAADQPGNFYILDGGATRAIHEFDGALGRIISWPLIGANGKIVP